MHCVCVGFASVRIQSGYQKRTQWVTSSALRYESPENVCFGTERHIFHYNVGENTFLACVEPIFWPHKCYPASSYLEQLFCVWLELR